LELIRQQKEAVQDQLQAMEKARHVKKGAPGIGDGVDEGGMVNGIGVQEWVAMVSLKFHPFVPQQQLLNRPIRLGLSKRVEDGRSPPALLAGHPRNGHEAILGVARPQGVEGCRRVGHGGPG
jgi:hypothetical protein